MEASEFYLEGGLLRVICVNKNVRPFRGGTYWTDPMNVQISNNGELEFNVTRTLAGVYTCNVLLFNQSIMVKIPSRNFTLIVNCKF